jgi:hypothetical protein
VYLNHTHIEKTMTLPDIELNSPFFEVFERTATKTQHENLDIVFNSSSGQQSTIELDVPHDECLLRDSLEWRGKFELLLDVGKGGGFQAIQAFPELEKNIWADVFEKGNGDLQNNKYWKMKDGWNDKLFIQPLNKVSSDAKLLAYWNNADFQSLDRMPACYPNLALSREGPEFYAGVSNIPMTNCMRLPQMSGLAPFSNVFTPPNSWITKRLCNPMQPFIVDSAGGGLQPLDKLYNPETAGTTATNMTGLQIELARLAGMIPVESDSANVPYVTTDDGVFCRNPLRGGKMNLVKEKLRHPALCNDFLFSDDNAARCLPPGTGLTLKLASSSLDTPDTFRVFAIESFHSSSDADGLSADKKPYFHFQFTKHDHPGIANLRYKASTEPSYNDDTVYDNKLHVAAVTLRAAKIKIRCEDLDLYYSTIKKRYNNMIDSRRLNLYTHVSVVPGLLTKSTVYFGQDADIIIPQGNKTIFFVSHLSEDELGLNKYSYRAPIGIHTIAGIHSVIDRDNESYLRYLNYPDWNDVVEAQSRRAAGCLCSGSYRPCQCRRGKRAPLEYMNMNRSLTKPFYNRNYDLTAIQSMYGDMTEEQHLKRFWVINQDVAQDSRPDGLSGRLCNQHFPLTVRTVNKDKITGDYFCEPGDYDAMERVYVHTAFYTVTEIQYIPRLTGPCGDMYHARKVTNGGIVPNWSFKEPSERDIRNACNDTCPPRRYFDACMSEEPPVTAAAAAGLWASKRKRSRFY